MGMAGVNLQSQPVRPGGTSCSRLLVSRILSAQRQRAKTETDAAAWGLIMGR
ncbi:hypothetical protein CAP2UW1_1700 [Candidatus Accumulibacter phosphatis]|uniref:Uncharacterized protein n=1 Tax=Accumulibacter regalis TaxID=522306 RepID=C7RUF8_ACCRE